MKNIHLVFTGIVVIALLCNVGTVTALDYNLTGSQGSDKRTDTIGPYIDPIGADSPLYDLKIALEDLDETFTFNDSQRVEKRIDHGKIRIAEVERELQLNRPEIAERALEQYRQKLNLTEGSLEPLSTNTTGLLHAQEMITRHQEVLTNLILKYPNNTGLIRAYDNSHSLELKFENKTEMRFTRSLENDNKTVYTAIRLQVQNHNNNNNYNDVKNAEQEKTEKQEKITLQKEKKEPTRRSMARPCTPPAHHRPESHGNDSEPSQDQGKNRRG